MRRTRNDVTVCVSHVPRVYHIITAAPVVPGLWILRLHLQLLGSGPPSGHQACPVIGQYRSRDLNTGLWLVNRCHVTWTLACDWSIEWQRYITPQLECWARVKKPLDNGWELLLWVGGRLFRYHNGLTLSRLSPDAFYSVPTFSACILHLTASKASSKMSSWCRWVLFSNHLRKILRADFRTLLARQSLTVPAFLWNVNLFEIQIYPVTPRVYSRYEHQS